MYTHSSRSDKLTARAIENIVAIRLGVRNRGITNLEAEDAGAHVAVSV